MSSLPSPIPPSPPDPPPLTTTDPDDSSPALIASFFGFHGAALALAKSAFSQEEMVSTLVLHARSSDAKTSLSAISQLTTLLKDIAKTQGLVSKARIHKVTKDASGSVTTSSFTSSLLSSRPSTRPLDGSRLRAAVTDPSGGLTLPPPQSP